MFLEDTISDEAATKGLGVASVGIGLTELLAPQQVEKMLGIEDRPVRRGVLRVLGVRELMHGVGLLGGSAKAAPVWARVAGDVLDTAALGMVAMKTKKPMAFAAVSLAVLGIGIADLYCATRTSVH